MNTQETTRTVWDYWASNDQGELQVGMIREGAGGVGIDYHTVAIIPPLPTDHPSQAEVFARIIRDALREATATMTQPDGLADWCAAHGWTYPWPKP